MCVCVLPPSKLFHLGTKLTSFLLSLQTRSLLSVFEEDAGTLTDYTNQLLQAMQRVYGAQVPRCPLTWRGAEEGPSALIWNFSQEAEKFESEQHHLQFGNKIRIVVLTSVHLPKTRTICFHC